ncbi:T-cell surface glycoprotein CD3 gamma chain-like [Xyrichtys novacula]|uniref:T-cell surface glycoprotein CD3 gamma chain-like n=1 Tax=Xyrichtys novacula TaxID=13765 RepID=A0AAV1FYQ7_XYRNO|nr:T-cell surface glycoprotein CD3 gamma chain-like [Xyrichtys novacula]
MKQQRLFPACLLLLWSLTDPSSTESIQPKVTTVSGGIKLTCTDRKIMAIDNGIAQDSLQLEYKDENSGEYTCVSKDNGEPEGEKMFVKFRTCDNCIELDEGSVAGIVVGEVVATTVIGVAVYLIACAQTRTGADKLDKKSSDRQHLIPPERNTRAPNDHYQPLKHKGGQKDTYDVLNKR